MEIKKLIIIGSGPAGLTAGIYAGREHLNPIIITGKNFGGMTSKLKNIENYPGFKTPIDGNTLIQNMKEQALKSGATFIEDNIVNFYPLKDKIILIGESQNEYHARSVIFATGINLNKSSFKGQNDFLGNGISTCLQCDAPLYKGKVVAVCGNSNDIFNSVTFLSNIAKKVFFITKNKTENFIDDILKLSTIEVLTNSIITQALGDKKQGLSSLLIKDKHINKEIEIKVDGLFLLNNEENNSLLYQDKIKTNKKGFIITKSNSSKTNIEGIFAAGDIRDKNFKQIVVACASGAKAALDAKNWLEKMDFHK